MRLYIDTSVYVSKYRDEFYGGGLPVYARQKAEELLGRALACEFYIITSTLVTSELEEKFGYFKENLQEDTSALSAKGKLIVLDANAHKTEAKMLDRRLRLGWKDCAHLLMCREAGAALVSWDSGLRRGGREIGLEVFRPEEL